MPLTSNDTLGQYRIIEKLGQGGMATVYKAYHAGLDRYVAVKVLHPELTEDPLFTGRFQREARLVAKLDHPNIVQVHDFAEAEGYPYLVMKFIEGETLKARLLRGPLTTDEIKTIVDSVGSALAYAHQQGILHRDIKPSNVLIARDGQVYLADFGLARIAQLSASTLSSDAIMGTPQYISPEQALGKSDLDAGTDIYSFGVMLYEMVVGQVPFSADTPFSIIYDHISSPLPLPRIINPSVPESVERVLLKSLAKERSDRYATVFEMVAAFKSAWDQAGVPMQGTAIKLPETVEPITPLEQEAAFPGSSIRTVGTEVVGKSKNRLFPWLYIAGGVMLVVCCLVAGITFIPGAVTWLAPPTPSPSPSPVPVITEPVLPPFTFCFGEQTWLTRDYFPEQEIEHCWDQGHYVTDLAYGNGEWTIVMTGEVSYTAQAYFVDPEFPKTKIRNYWDQGYDITDILYTDGQWVVVMSVGTGFTNQSYLTDLNFPDSDIQSYWDEGYSITSMEYGNGSWVVVMSQGSALGKQVYFFENTFPESQISTYWASDYYITGVAYGGVNWAVVMSQLEKYSNQYYYNKESFPSDGIKEDWDDGFFITNLFFGNSRWVVVMSKP